MAKRKLKFNKFVLPIVKKCYVNVYTKKYSDFVNAYINFM